MVDPLNSLMTSAQRLANDKSLSDDTYVYLKDGKLHAENRLSHAFTFSSTKAKTSQALYRAFTKYYGDDGCTARKEFERSYYGFHQLKVKDLRKAFATAEATKLNTMTESLSKAYGEAMGDALAPLSTHVARGGSVTQKMIGQVMDRVFGDGASAVVLGNAKGNYLESMPALMQAASDAKAEIDKLQGKPGRVMDAIFDVCRRGPLAKANVEQTLAKCFPGCDLSALKGEIGRLPDAPSMEQVTSLFDHANLLYNRAQITAFTAKVVKDSSLEMHLGLNKRYERGDVLSEELRRDIRARMPQLKAAAKNVRNAAARFLKQHSQASDGLKALAKSSAEKLIRTGEFSAEAIENMVNGLKDQYRRETNFGFGLSYEVKQHEDWSTEQKQFFRDVMTKLHAEYPAMNLFTEGNSTVAQKVAKYLDGEYAVGPADVAAYGRDAEIFCAEAMALAGDLFASMLMTKLPDIIRSAGEGNLTMDEAAQVCFGLPADAEGARRGGQVEDRFSVMQQAYVSERLATPAQRDEAYRWARRELPHGSETEVKELARKRLHQQLDAPTLGVCLGLQMGLSLEAALQRGSDRDRALELADFAVKPRAVPGRTQSREKEVANWLIDFQRQGSGKGTKRLDQGATRITVTEPGGAVTSVHNGKEGLPEAEVEAFEADRLTSKHQAVIDALVRLCGANEAQCTTAIAMLSQAGPVALNRTLMQLVNGAHGDGEHAPMIYDFSKRANGDVVLHAQSPADPAKARLDVTAVIRSDGTHKLEALSFMSPAARQEALEIEPLI